MNSSQGSTFFGLIHMILTISYEATSLRASTWGNWKARLKSESVSDENLKKQPKLSEKERHNPKNKKSESDQSKKKEPEYEYVDIETIHSGFWWDFII